MSIAAKRISLVDRRDTRTEEREGEEESGTDEYKSMVKVGDFGNSPIFSATTLPVGGEKLSSGNRRSIDSSK